MENMQGKVEVEEVNTQKNTITLCIYIQKHTMMYGICKLIMGITTITNQ